MGGLTDRFGVRRVIAFYLLAGIGAGAVALTPVVMVRAFPPAVRFSGVSFSYNIAPSLVSGLTPLFISWLAHLNRITPAHYIAVASVAGLLATFVGPSGRWAE